MRYRLIQVDIKFDLGLLTCNIRSPINSANNIICPTILFHGLDDHAVPPSQTEEMIKALNANKVPNAYVTYAGEGHGECLKMHGFGAKLHKDG